MMHYGRSQMATVIQLGCVFDPEQVNAMAQAFEFACIRLNVGEQDQALRNQIACKVVTCARLQRAHRLSAKQLSTNRLLRDLPIADKLPRS
jgi:hypothetical protein